MAKQVNGELDVLYRLLYVLEERSVSRLSEQDDVFQSFIADVYNIVDKQAAKLVRTSRLAA